MFFSSLADNFFTGDIPTTFGGSTVLVTLYYPPGSFPLCVPTKLFSFFLSVSDLHANLLSGTVPVQLATSPGLLSLLGLNFTPFPAPQFLILFSFHSEIWHQTFLRDLFQPNLVGAALRPCEPNTSLNRWLPLH